MLLEDRGQPIAVVRLRVRLAADPEEPEVEQPEGGGQRALVRHPLEPQMLGDAAAGHWQPCGDREHAVVLGTVTLQPPLLVIDVLPPAGVIGAYCLQMPVGHRADPDLLPSRRDDQQPTALGILGWQPLPVLVQEDEASAGPTPRPAGLAREDRTQTWHAPFLSRSTHLPRLTASETCRQIAGIRPGRSCHLPTVSGR